MAHEDDTERVLAGLEIQRYVADHARRVLLDFAIESFGVRVGIEAGLAVTGPVGGGSHVEYGATGDVVNTAARLQSEARVGSVLVGPTARAQVRELFHWSDPTAVELRGRTRSSTWRWRRPRGDAPGPAASRAVVRRSSDGNGSWRWHCESSTGSRAASAWRS